MNKVGIVTSSLHDENKNRGVGIYTQNLLENLRKVSKSSNIEIVEVEGSEKIEQIDLLHYPFFDLSKATLPIFKKHKTIVTIHDCIPLEFPKHYPLGLIGSLNFYRQFISLRSVEKIITDSNYSKKSIEMLLKVPSSKIEVTYLAASDVYKKVIDEKILSGVSKKYNLPSKFILYVGDINYNKNLGILLKACEKLCLPLVLVGKNLVKIESLDLDHPELIHLKELLPYFNSKQVHRLGFVNDLDLRSIYSKACLYVQPSFSEGFGVPVVEAISCKTPVLVSSGGSLPELVDSNAKVMFEPKNLNDLLNKITHLLKKPIILSSQFSWEKTAIQTLEVYNSLLK